jgi:diacylglycerol kinase family enzyme
LWRRWYGQFCYKWDYCKQVTLGVIPIGSGNDFAKSLGLPKNFEKNLSILKMGNIRGIDVVENEWGYFVNTFGMGLDGLTNYHASNSPFNRGMLRYFWGGLKALFQAKPFDISIKIPEITAPITYRSWMITIANGKNEGGRYTISPSSCNYDGKLEIVVVKDITRLRLVFEFLKLSVGLPFNQNIVDVFVTKSGCETTNNRVVKSHADGEQVYTHKVNKFKLLPGALNVIVND